MHMHKVIYLFTIVYRITCWDWWIAELNLSYPTRPFEPFEMIVGLFDATH